MDECKPLTVGNTISHANPLSPFFKGYHINARLAAQMEVIRAKLNLRYGNQGQW